MKSKLLLLMFLQIAWLNETHSATPNCSTVKIQHAEIGVGIHPETLGNLYARAMLKLAHLAVEENFETFEEVAPLILQTTKVKYIAALKNRVGSYKFWEASRRMPNVDFVRIATLMTGHEENNLEQAEMRALWLVFKANERNSELDFSRIIYKLISKKENSIHVNLPQIKMAIDSYPIHCLGKHFTPNELTEVISNLYNTVEQNIREVSLEQEKIILGKTVIAHVPALKITRKKFDPSNISELEMGRRLLSEVGGSFNSYRKSNNVIHAVSNLETIKHFHKFYGLSTFSILNKKEKTLTIYDESANVLEKINISVSSLDDLINAGGAGIYHSAIEGKNVFYAKALADNGMREVFRLRANQEVKLHGPLYILPFNDKEHKFRIKNKGLAFSGAQFYRKSRNYNYTINSEAKFKLVIKHNYKSEFVERYIKTLAEEKNRLTQILKIDNDDYNILAGFAIGVLAPETDFGKNWKYVLKEYLPGAVALAKGNGLDISQNSRGPTQVKVIPEVLLDYYSIDKDNLSRPENAAKATIAISADFLKQLRVMGVNHKSINEENIQNYLYYLYQGKRAQIKKALATPDDNQAIRKITKVVNQLEFLEY